MAALKRHLTPGHGIGVVLMLALVYQAWGRVFVPGGTGSNVVLGLLVALAALYMGATNLGPFIDDAIFPKATRLPRRRAREAHELADDIDRAVRDERRRAKRKKGKVPAEAIEQLVGLSASLRGGAAAKDVALIDKTIAEADAVIAAAFGTGKPGAGVASQARSLAFAFAVAIALRLFLVAPFQIPSGSMVPTLLIGDHLFVFRASYGLQSPVGTSYLARWATPTPGDIVVFEAPPWVGHNAGEDWIKRVIAGPGQRVKRIDKIVYVDGTPYQQGSAEQLGYMDFRERGGGGGTWEERTAIHSIEQVPNKPHSVLHDSDHPVANWPNGMSPEPRQRGLQCSEDECTVQPGFVFVMGDNRDNSADGREWGAVPIDNIKGRAMFIWVSVDGSTDSVQLGKFTLPRFRWERIFDGL